MRTLCIVFVLALIAGCSPRNFPASTETTDRVNTTIEVVLHDTLYALRLPDERVRAAVPQDDSSFLETSAAWSRAWVEDGRLHHELGHKNREPILVPIQVPERRVTVDSTHTEFVRTPVYVKKKAVVVAADGDGGRVYLVVCAVCPGRGKRLEVEKEVAVGAGNRFEEAFRNADSAFKRRYGL